MRTDETLNLFIVGSIWHGGSSSASEGAATPDPCLVSPEVTESREHPQAARGPEDSPCPSTPEPQEWESPSSSMRFAEGPPEGCLASPEGEPEGWPLVQHSWRELSPNGPGEASPASVPQDDNLTQHKVVSVIPSAEGETGSKEEGQRLSSSSSTDQLAGIPPTAPPELMKVQLPGEDARPGDFKSQGQEAAAGLPRPESRQGTPKAPAAHQGQESSASLEEPPLKPEIATSQEPVPECPVEGPPQDFTDDTGFLGACPPTGTSSGAAQEAKAKADFQESCQQPMGALPPTGLPWDSLGPALVPGDKGSWEETLGALDAQSHLQTRSQDAQPSQVTWAATGDQPEGILFMSPEPTPQAATEDVGPASSLPSQPAALASVAAEQAKEMVSMVEMPVLTDLATEWAEAGLSGPEKQASDLRGEGEGLEGGSREIPAPAPLKERAELGNRELSHEVHPKVPALPTPSASDESASRSPGPKDEAEPPEGPAVANEESKVSGADPRGQGAAPGPLDGADTGNLQAEQPEAWDCKPDPEVDKDEVSQLTGDEESKGLPNTVLAQPVGEEIPGHVDRSDSPSEDAAWNTVARGMMGESQVVHASGSLHQLPEQHPSPPSGPEGTGECVLPRGTVWAGPGPQTKCPDTLQDVEGLGRMDSLPALESEKSDFLSVPAPEVVPKAQEAESMPEIKSGSHPSAQNPGHGEGEGSLRSPHPRGLGRDTAGQEVLADGPPPPEEENWAVDCRLTTLSLEQGQQGNLSHPGDSDIEVTASERPLLCPENHLQTSQTHPDASVFNMLRETSQGCGSKEEAYPGDTDFKNLGADSPQIHIPVGPREDVNLSTHGGKQPASETELQSELPKGSLSDAPSSPPGGTVLENPETEKSQLSAPMKPELPALREKGQEGECSGSQPSRSSSPAADTSQDPSLAGSLSRKEYSCAGQGPNESQQELVDGLNTGSQHEEACLEDAGISGAADAWPQLQDLGKTEKASGNTVGAPPCWPDSVALPEAAHSQSVPAPASPRATPAQDAPVREAGEETQEGGQQPGLVPQKEMEHLTASDAEVLELSGIFPSAKDHGVDGAETCGKADGGALGMWQAPGEPGSLQTEEHSSPGEEASTSALGEQHLASCQDAWPLARELAESPRSVADLSAAQVVPDPKRLLPSGPPEEAAPGTPYLHIEGAARKGLEDSVVKAVSPQGPGAAGESPCSTREPLLASEIASSREGFAESSLQAGAAGEGISAAPASLGSSKAATLEGPVDSVPYLDRMPFLAKSKETTGEEKWSGAPGASAEPSETPACPVSEESKGGEAARETEGSGERMLEPSKDPRRGASAGVDASCRQTGMLAGLPDFREHITKIFEKSVLGALTADWPQSTQGEKVGAGKRVMGKGLMVPSPEKLPDGTQGVAVTPLPTLPTGLWVDSKERKQELAVEAEIYHLGPQDPAPGKLPGLAWLAAEHTQPGASEGKEVSEAPQMLADSKKLEGAGEGWWPGPGGGQAHSQQAGGPQEAASDLSSQAAPPEASGADLQVAPQSHAEGDSGPDDSIPSGKQSQETAHQDSQPREDGPWGSSHPRALGDTPGSTSARGASPHRDIPPLPEAVGEPCTPDPLGGERRRAGAAGISETQDALGTQGVREPPAGEVADNPLEPGLEAGAAGEAEGDVTLNTAGTRTCVSEDLPETGTTRMFSGAAVASAVPGSPGDPGCSEGPLRMDAEVAPGGGRPAGPPQAEEQPRPEFPAFAEDGKIGVSSPTEPDETRDLKLQNLDPEALDAERYLE